MASAWVLSLHLDLVAPGLLLHSSASLAVPKLGTAVSHSDVSLMGQGHSMSQTSVLKDEKHWDSQKCPGTRLC